jgi:hypothetical protein
MTDVEKSGDFKPYVVSDDSGDERELPPALRNVAHHGFFGTLRHYEAVLDRKFGIESHGPARMMPEDRDPRYSKWTNQATMALLWASGTMNLSCFTTGFLGWELGLDLSQTIGITVLASLVGAAVTVCILLLNLRRILTESGMVCNNGPRNRIATSLDLQILLRMVAGQDYRISKRY